VCGGERRCVGDSSHIIKFSLASILERKMSEPSPVIIDTDGTKARRLVPQFSLTKQDLGADSNGRSGRQLDTPKKPG
jgi:hypothetical protein